jgi:hypothetical protein
MPSLQNPIDALLDGVKRLSQSEQREFASRLARLRGRAPGLDQENLLEAARTRLSRSDERRLEQLIAKSERGELTKKESEAYRHLARKAEQLNLVRMQALAELARRQSKPISQIIDELGSGDNSDGA